MLHLRTLGGLSLSSDGSPVSTSANRRRSLALLALAAASGDQGLSRERAQSLLWPDLSTDRAANNLKQLVFATRQALGTDVFPREATNLQIDPSLLVCDNVTFQHLLNRGRLADAVEVYGGPFLDGFRLPGLIEFDRWIESEREQLTRRYTESLKRLALDAAGGGNGPDAVRWWRKLATHDPLSDENALGLIRALAQTGDFTGALQYARVHSSLVKQELDVEPGPAFRALVEEVKQAQTATPSTATTLRLQTPATNRAGYLSTPSDLIDAAPNPSGAAVVGTPSDPVAGVSPFPVFLSATQPSAPADVGNRPDYETPMVKRFPTRDEQVSSRRLIRARITAVASLSLLVVVSGGRLLSKVSHADTPSAGQSIIVLPFAIGGDNPTPNLSAATGELLASSLDGSLGIHASPAITSSSRKNGASEASLAESRAAAPGLAAKLGATLYVYGEVVSSGNNIRVTAELRDRSAGGEKLVERAEADGNRDELLSLVDRLAAQILASRLGGGRDEVVRVASMSTSSFDAVKAYFAGEEHLHAGRFRAAMDGFREAIRIDSGFALAHYGLSTAADVLGEDEVVHRAAADALRNASRLPTRQKRLLTAYVTRQRGDAELAEILYSQLTIDYPADAEAWFGLAETLYHLNPLRGRAAAEARRPLERVIALDSGDVSALVHLARIASLEERPDLTRRLVARARALAPDDVVGRYALHALALGGSALGGGQGPPREQVEHAAAGLPGPTAIDLLLAGEYTLLDRFANQFVTPGLPPDLRGYGYRLRSLVAGGHGRINEAMALIDTSARYDLNAAIESRSRLAVMDFVPLDRARIEQIRNEIRQWTPEAHATDDPIDSTAHMRAHPYLRLHRLGLLSFRLGDTAATSAAAKSLETMSRMPNGSILGVMLAGNLRARLEAARGRYAEALALIERSKGITESGISPLAAYDRLFHAQLLDRVGRPDDAIEYYRQFGTRSPFELPLVWEAELEMARVYERQGNAREAQKWFARVAEMLKDADPGIGERLSARR